MNTRPKTPEEKRYRKFQMTDLIRQTLDEEAVSSFDFYGRRKDNPHVMETRQKICFMLHERGFSTPEIGDMIERDHTTVMYNIKQYKQRLKKENNGTKSSSA